VARRGTAPRWKRLDSDDRRAQILREARRLFRKRTYSAVSTEEIARRAGVTRGLVHHYFGTKRELFLEVARDAIATAPTLPGAGLSVDRPLDELVAQGVTMWLDAIESDPQMFLVVFGAEGFGRDRALERIVAAGREATVDAMIALLGWEGTGEGGRAALRSYAGLVEAATREWIQRKTLTREQVHALLSAALVAIVGKVRRR
jgi:AcrR family transcriptional regulator